MRNGIMALEELKAPTKKKLSLESILTNRIQQHRKIALEGLLDFLFGKKQADAKVEPKVEPKKELKVGEVITYLEGLKDKEFTVNVYYDKIETYVAFLDELIQVGLPFLEKDMERLLAVLKFIESKGKDISEFKNLKELYKIAGINHPVKHTDGPEIDFKTFEITINHYHNSKETSNDPKFFVTYDDNDVGNFVEHFGISEEAAEALAPLMTLDELIPSLDCVYPKNTSKLNKITISPEDPNHSKLLDLAIKLIKECNAITLRGDAKKLKDLASDIDDTLADPYGDYGDGDEYGMYRLFYHSNLYMYELKMGFEEDFIETFKKS